VVIGRTVGAAIDLTVYAACAAAPVRRMVAPDQKEHTVRRTVTIALIAALALIAGPAAAADATPRPKAPAAEGFRF